MTAHQKALSSFNPMQRGLIAAIATISIVGFGLSLMIPVLSLELERRGVSSFMIGLQTTVMAIASMIGSLVAPRVIARFDIRSIAFAALAVTALTFPLYPLIENSLIWFPLRAVNGFFFASLFIASEFWITSIAPPKRRATVMGIYATCLSIGFALGPAVLTLIGTQGLAPFLTGTAIVTCAIFPVLMPGTLRPAPHEETKEHVLFKVIRIAPVAILAAVIFGAIESSNFSFMAIWGVRTGLSDTEAALLVTMLGLGSVLLQIPIGMMADRWNRCFMLIFCAVVSAAAFLLASYLIESKWMLYALMLPYGGVVAGIYTIGLAILGEKFSGAMLASANAAFVTGYGLGMVAIPPLAGWGMEIINPHGYVYVCSGLLLVYALIVFVSPQRRKLQTSVPSPIKSDF